MGDLVAGELSIGAPTGITTLKLHVTSQKALWGPRVVLGLLSKNELLEKRSRASEDS